MKKSIKFSLYILCYLCIFNTTLLAQVTVIPDTSFERSLVTQGIDSDGLVNGQISNVDASSVTVLNLVNNNISDLTGIQAFVALRRFNCSYNQLTSLDVRGNIHLESLNCKNNQLTTLDFNNTNLVDLSCSNNQLTVLHVDSTNLTDLYCGNNQLSTLTLSNNINLTNLDVNTNLLTNLDVSSNINIQFLNCGNNQLTTLDLSNLPSLFSINCPNNQLTSLNFNNTNLTYLTCSNNRLTNLNISNNTNLLYLYCDTNQLTTLNTTNNKKLLQIYCQHNQLTALDISNNPLAILNCANNQLHYLNLKRNPRMQFSGLSGFLHLVALENNIPTMTICVDNPILVENDTFWTKDSTAIYTDICQNTTLMGLVRNDFNSNCIVDSTDSNNSHAILSITKGNSTIYKTSNTIGRYTAELDTGSYTISLTSSNPYTAPCLNTQIAVIDSLSDMDTINWALQVTHYCPFLTTTLSAPFLRATGGGSNYTINYCNQGTAPAYDAYVEVTIDSSLNVLGTSLPIWNQVGNVYTFDLDTVHIGQCGSFTINVIADSTAPLGQVVCSEVHIYPDSLCNNTWNGPIIQTSGTCQLDTVSFRIENIGSNMNTALEYIVIEDNIIMRNDTFKLTNNGSQTVNISALPDKTYRIEAEQAPNFPPTLGSRFAYSNVVGCVAGPASTVNILQYYNGNTAPWIDIDCQPLIAAYDPNDKTPQPVGYGPQHYITNPTPIEYRVRFQNTGNDTAFNVVVFDTISTHLDIATLKMKAASDDYTWSLTNGNALRVNFPNIKLVDSTTNEPLSHGFFTYEITPKSNLPLETRIENTAAIYFDYNPPIFTNTTFHTIGENFIPKVMVGVTKINQDHIQINAYPNPFDQMTTIAVEGEIFETLEIIVTDVAGRILQTKQVQHQNQIQLHRDNLLQGIYLYQIKGNGRLIGTGKLIVR